MNKNVELGDLLIAINKNLKTKVERDLKKYGLGMGQLQILMVFFSNIEKTYTQNELSKLLNVDKGNISRSMVKLLDKTYLTQDIDESKHYRLSDLGITLKGEIITSFRNLNEIMTLGIDDNDIKQTIKTLTTISRNLEDTL